MIGPAEIEDIMLDYADQLGASGAAKEIGSCSWPLSELPSEGGSAKSVAENAHLPLHTSEGP